VAHDAVRIDALAVADARRAPVDGRRRHAEAVREGKPGDAGAIAADARVVGDQAADADLQREAEGKRAGERADDDDITRAGVAVAACDRVEDDDAAARVVIDRTQGASLPEAPIVLSRAGSVALVRLGVGTLADGRGAGDGVRRGAIALLAPPRDERAGGRDDLVGRAAPDPRRT